LQGSERFSHLREHAEYLNTLPLGMVGRWGSGMTSRVNAGAHAQLGGLSLRGMVL